jgi:general stress protein YciG
MANKTHAILTNDADIDQALQTAKAFAAVDRRVTKAEYDSDTDEVRLHFADGVKILIPRSKLQGLKNASRADLKKVELLGNGTGLHWPKLDVDHYVPGLLEGVFGTKQWMAALGRRGGSVTSKAKVRAARENGRKGGRPKQSANHPRSIVAARSRKSTVA